MKDLSRHIEYLLCEHDSVAIPGIGIFVTEELPARYSHEENLYLPPVRSVHLDTTNKDDDHKLEDCLIQLHHVTRNVANKWIAEYVEGINQSLMDMGIMDMGTIGRLVYADNTISFEVCDAGVNTPELYGLDSFHIAKLPAHAHTSRHNTDQTHFTIRLRRTTVHRTMTAAAMLIVALTVIVPNYGLFDNTGLHAGLTAAESLTNIFCATSQPISPSLVDSHDNISVSGAVETCNPNVSTPQQIQGIPNALHDNNRIEDSSQDMSPVLDTTAVVDVNADNANAGMVQEPQHPTAQPQASATVSQMKPAEPTSEVKGYCIVMASAITNKGAEHLIAKLNKEGFHNAVKYKDKGMLRVLLTGYDSESSARAHVSVVKAMDKLYSGSWIKQF